MDPLTAYLLTVAKNEAHDATRRFLQCESALGELGYWLQMRPIGTERGQLMPTTRIQKECRFVESFPSRYQGTEYCDGFDEVVDVYADAGV